MVKYQIPQETIEELRKLRSDVVYYKTRWVIVNKMYDELSAENRYLRKQSRLRYLVILIQRLISYIANYGHYNYHKAFDDARRRNENV